MFNNKTYFEVNREERHFGNLFISSIIYDDMFRDKFFELINTKLSLKNYLTDNLDVYSETAILRDYWHDLGDQNKWNLELLHKRKSIIELLFKYFNICFFFCCARNIRQCIPRNHFRHLWCVECGIISSY